MCFFIYAILLTELMHYDILAIINIDKHLHMSSSWTKKQHNKLCAANIECVILISLPDQIWQHIYKFHKKLLSTFKIDVNDNWHSQLLSVYTQTKGLIHTQIYTYKSYLYTHTNIHVLIHTHKYTRTYTCTHTDIQVPTHTNTNIQVPTHTHTCAHTAPIHTWVIPLLPLSKPTTTPRVPFTKPSFTWMFLHSITWNIEHMRTLQQMVILITKGLDEIQEMRANNKLEN